jgi:hypothetical protein
MGAVSTSRPGTLSPVIKRWLQRKGKGMIVEVRGNGCCTVFPGSVHPSGEFIQFDDPNEFTPDESTWEVLIRAATQIAIATAVHPCWSEANHSRHSLALALAAFLARRDWKREDVSNLIEAIAKEANDEELEDRLRCVDDTFSAQARSRQISGDEELARLIGTELRGRHSELGIWEGIEEKEKSCS